MTTELDFITPSESLSTLDARKVRTTWARLWYTIGNFSAIWKSAVLANPKRFYSW